jgi:hypothetical protein
MVQLQLKKTKNLDRYWVMTFTKHRYLRITLIGLGMVIE